MLSNPVRVEVIRRGVEARAATGSTRRSVEFEVEFIAVVKVSHLPIEVLVCTWRVVVSCVHICGEHSQLLGVSSIFNIFHCEVVRCRGGLGTGQCWVVSNVSTASGVEVLELPVVLDVVACRDCPCGSLELALRGGRTAGSNAGCCDAGVRTVVECVVERWSVCSRGVNTRHIGEGREESADTFNVRGHTAVWHKAGQRSVRIRATRVGDLDVGVRRTRGVSVAVQVGRRCHSLPDSDGTGVGLSGRDVSCCSSGGTCCCGGTNVSGLPTATVTNGVGVEGWAVPQGSDHSAGCSRVVAASCEDLACGQRSGTRSGWHSPGVRQGR